MLQFAERLHHSANTIHPAAGSSPGLEKGGCAGDFYGEWPSILERMKTWRTLKPGESLETHGSRSQFFYSDRRPGRYEFSATYTPPSVADQDRQLISGLGLESPNTTIVSPRLTFTRRP
jgi:hypothetical protein